MADIVDINSAREARFRGGTPSGSGLSDLERYRRALEQQKVNDDSRWTPCDDDAWRQAMRELDEVIGPPSDGPPSGGAA